MLGARAALPTQPQGTAKGEVAVLSSFSSIACSGVALQFAHAHQIKHAKDLIKWNLIDALLLVLPGLTVEEHGSRWKEAVRQAADQVSAAPRPNRLY